MKNIVVFDEYNERDLKPSTLLQQYIDLTRECVGELVKKEKLKVAACPGCHSLNAASEFGKFGLTYKECADCHSLYIAARPDDAALNKYYRQAKASVFWREQLSKKTNQKRKEKIIKPRFQWILDSTQEYLPKARSFADINTSQYGYIEEIGKASEFEAKTLIDPFVKLEGPSAKINVIETPWWSLKTEAAYDVISLFEVADRTSDVDGLFSSVRRLLKPGGLCFMTAILASGFDLQVLWKDAQNLFPPDRLNVLSTEGMPILWERHGFECLELSTPGILDVEIVAKAVREDPNLPVPRFVRYLLNARDAETQIAFQEFLQASQMSSYGRILLRKK